jgi:hypothetical protein
LDSFELEEEEESSRERRRGEAGEKKLFTKTQMRFMLRAVEGIVDRKLGRLTRTLEKVCARLGIESGLPRLKVPGYTPRVDIADNEDEN